MFGIFSHQFGSKTNAKEAIELFLLLLSADYYFSTE